MSQLDPLTHAQVRRLLETTVIGDAIDLRLAYARRKYLDLARNS